jgi:hypothetical protein
VVYKWVEDSNSCTLYVLRTYSVTTGTLSGSAFAGGLAPSKISPRCSPGSSFLLSFKLFLAAPQQSNEHHQNPSQQQSPTSKAPSCCTTNRGIDIIPPSSCFRVCFVWLSGECIAETTGCWSALPDVDSHHSTCTHSNKFTARPIFRCVASHLSHRAYSTASLCWPTLLLLFCCPTFELLANCFTALLSRYIHIRRQCISSTVLKGDCSSTYYQQSLARCTASLRFVSCTLHWSASLQFLHIHIIVRDIPSSGPPEYRNKTTLSLGPTHALLS